MKKLLLTALVMVMGVMNVSATDELYLRTDFDGSSHWNNDDTAMKFTYVETNSNNEDVYTYTINASDIQAKDNWLRLQISGWGAQICPYTNDGSFTFSFDNGQNQTYGAKYEKSYFQGDTYSYGIPHSSIKASQYKITVFRGNNETYYENENCRVMWIEVEIVSMPATISSLGYSTFSSAYALDLSGVTAYYAPSTSNNKVVLKKATGKVPAGTGLLLAGSGTVNIPVVETSEATALDFNYLEASVTAKEITPSTGTSDFYYFLAGNSAETLGFYYLNPDGTTYTSGAGKAYLRVYTPLASETTSTGARASWIFQDNISTSISNVQNAQKEDTLYDLQGRIAKSAKAGLYIKNGKKFIVK